MTYLTLGDVAEYINGRAFKPNEWEDTGLPIIRIQNLTNSTQVINRTSKVFEDKYLVTDGDLLFAWSASLGAHIWRGENGWLNQHIFKVVPHDNIDKMYLYYYLLHVIDELYSKTHGSGMVHITLKPFKATPIPVPPLNTQKKIAEIISKLFSSLDEAKEKSQEVVDGFETRKAAILHKAFSAKLTAKWREENNVSANSWEETKLGYVLREIKYGTSEKSDYSYTGIPVLRIPNIGDMELIFDDIKFLRQHDCLPNEYLAENDILIIRSNGSKDLVGKCALVKNLDQKYTYASFLIRLRVLEDVFSPYIVWYLNSENARRQLFGKAKSSAGIHNINSKEISDIDIVIPHISEQKEIVRILQKLIKKETHAKEVAETVIMQIDSIKNSILDRAFRGELGTTDLNVDISKESL